MSICCRCNGEGITDADKNELSGVTSKCWLCDGTGIYVVPVDSELQKILKQHKAMIEVLKEISTSTHEFNPWTIVPTRDALLAKKCLEEINE